MSCNKKSEVSAGSSRAEILKLLREATRQKDTMMIPLAADSLIDLALSKALQKEDSLMITYCYIASLKDKDAEKLSIEDGKLFLKQALNYAERLHDPNIATKANYAMCEFLLQKKKPDEASVILGIAANAQSSDKKNDIERLIIQSKINQQQDQSFEQLKALLDAQYMAADLENDSLQYISLQLLSDFYFSEGNYEKSLDYSQKIKEILQGKKPLDSVKWYYTEANRLSVFVKTMNNEAVYNIAEKINNFGKRKNIPKLCSFAQSSLRSYFIEKKDFNRLKIWYTNHPDELKVLKKNNLPQFYRVKAYIAEQENKKDSALLYFDMAGQNIEKDNPYLLYNYYLRKSELEERNQLSEKAETDLETAYNYSQQTKLYKEQIDLANKIIAYHDSHDNKEKADYFLRNLNSSNANYIEMLNNDNIRKIELNTIFAHKELDREKEIEKTNRKHNIQYFVITLGILFFIMTIITLSLYHMPKWWLKSMSFISFIVLFEFIILIIDSKLHDWSHGDPYKILGVKVCIIAVLLPLHHWLEKKFLNLLLRGEVPRFFQKMKKKIFRSKNEIHLND
ncbi:hypothetical protein KSK37_06935 [Kaistella sp. DKR-2]|uniref:hypothetical protein n=1 Tax=Kaistella soli TaxID=2849654 RepID=UPI001C26CC9E|nr:hypothetical protein [Kaistella soli]MBU8882814.1 hypothetical protein [Kaistella soli]